MARTELSNSKSICVLAVVVCCFAILWPKIFLPMFQTALQMSSGDDNGRRKDSSVYPPKVREAMRLSRPEDFTRRPARTFQREPKRPENEVPKTGGLMGLVMPIYTIGIIVFFLYTMLKMVFKGKSDEETVEDEPKPLLTKLAIDPEHRKFVLHDQYDDEGRPIKREAKTKCNSKTSRNIKSGLKTEKAVKSFGKENVSKALHILIREMEEFKSKMADVERMRHNISRIGSESEENSGNKKCCNGSENNSEVDQDGIDSEEKLVKDDKNDGEEDEHGGDESDDDEQIFYETEMDFQTNDVECNQESDDLKPNFVADYDINCQLRNRMNSEVWKALSEQMNDMKHMKEE